MPPKKTPIVQWATENENPDAHIYTPKPFQEAWLECFEDPYIEKIVLKKSARVGYAIFIDTAVGWIITNDPGNIMIAQNTENDAEKFATKEIGKLIKSCYPVSERMFGKNTSKEKSFLGGDLSIVWATSAGSFRMATIRYFFGDEVSGYPKNTDGEGDPVDLGITRTETEAKRKIVLGSTPKEAGTCRITEEFELTDQRYLYLPCPHCGHMQRLKLDNFRYDPSDFHTAHFVCEGCGEGIKEHHKYGMLQKKEWRATREFTCCGVHQEPEQWDSKGTALCIKCGKPGDTNERGKVDAGFHIWSAYNDNPNTSLPSLASAYEKAKKNPAKRQEFMNTKVGVAYSDVSRAYRLNSFDVLYARRELYAPEQELPRKTRILLASVDTQKNRFEYHFWAVGDNGEMWAVHYGVIYGDPEDEDIQQLLVETLSQPFRLQNGRSIVAYAVVMDCNGHAWKAMLEFVAPYQGWIYAIRGDAYGKNKFKTDLTLSYSQHKEVGCDFRVLNVHQLKNRAAERLNIEQPGKNHIHFPANEVFNLNYFQMLTSEELVGSGSNIKWTKKKGQTRNEPWDLLVYVLWLCDFLRPIIRLASEDEPLGLVESEQQISQPDYEPEYGGYSDNYDVSNYEGY